MLIMIAGPYKGGSTDPGTWAENLRSLNSYAWQVFKRGHIPVIGVNAALPVILEAGNEHYEDIMMPVSLALADRCDAVLRIGGPSSGADREVERFREKNLPVYYALAEIP